MPMPDSPELLAARQRVQDAIVDMVRLLVDEVRGPNGEDHDDDLWSVTAGEPIVVAWVAGVEVTNMRLEQSGRAYRQGFGGLDQPLSASEGLGRMIERRFQ